MRLTGPSKQHYRFAPVVQTLTLSRTDRYAAIIQCIAVNEEEFRLRLRAADIAHAIIPNTSSLDRINNSNKMLSQIAIDTARLTMEVKYTVVSYMNHINDNYVANFQTFIAQHDDDRNDPNKIQHDDCHRSHRSYRSRRSNRDDYSTRRPCNQRK